MSKRINNIFSTFSKRKTLWPNFMTSKVNFLLKNADKLKIKSFRVPVLSFSPGGDRVLATKTQKKEAGMRKKKILFCVQLGLFLSTPPTHHFAVTGKEAIKLACKENGRGASEKPRQATAFPVTVDGQYVVPAPLASHPVANRETETIVEG